MSVSQAMRHAGGEGMDGLLLTNSAAAREDWYRVRIGIMWPRQAADMGRLDVVGVLLQRHGPFPPQFTQRP